MQLIHELMAEHDLIDQVLGSLRAYVEDRARGAGNPADAPAFMAFFRCYAGDFHHAREEEILFAALVQKAELPADRGPIATMIADHRHLAELLDQIDPLLGCGGLDAAAAERMKRLALAYSHALWHHIDAENSVILPESEIRLQRHRIQELPSPPPNAAELQARIGGEELILKYPPLQDREVLRGDGCVHCPAFGDTCRGLEREWWNEWEWEEFQDHMGKD